MPKLPTPHVPVLPRIPGLPDPLRRCRIPDDLDAVTTVAGHEDPAAAGVAQRDVDRVWRAVQRLYRSGVHPAIALCVRRNGAVVLDRAIGHARGNGPADPPDAPKVAATPATPFCIYSASKAVTATVVHLLDERGLLHVDDRVVEYLPEFGAHGKDAITIEHVLSHRAGVPGLPASVLDLDNLADREFLVRTICEAKTRTRPGKLLAYHAVSGGFILGEVVHRVTGDDIRTVLQREVLDPLGFRWGGYGVAPEDVTASGWPTPRGRPRCRPSPPCSSAPWACRPTR